MDVDVDMMTSLEASQNESFICVKRKFSTMTLDSIAVSLSTNLRGKGDDDAT